MCTQALWGKKIGYFEKYNKYKNIFCTPPTIWSFSENLYKQFMKF